MGVTQWESDIARVEANSSSVPIAVRDRTQHVRVRLSCALCIERCLLVPQKFGGFEPVDQAGGRHCGEEGGGEYQREGHQ